jgi:hypothetical protein
VDLTYYTGGMDTVPHTPEFCGAAAGATLLRNEDFPVDVPNGPDLWRQADFTKVVFVDRQDRQYAQYYVFLLNGRPERSREMVRFLQWNPRIRYCYFGKIQIGPRSAMNKDTDRRSREFIRDALPFILKDFPTPSDLRKLEASGKG